MTESNCNRFDEAIDALWALAMEDLNNLEQYKRHIAELRFKKIDCLFAEISERTASLREAARVLEQAVAIASGTTPAAVLERVHKLIDQISGDEPETPMSTGSARAVGRAALGMPMRDLPDGRLRILCVHGVGDHRDGRWKQQWTAAMQQAVDAWNPKVLVDPIWCDYDDLVVEHGVDSGEYGEALLRLGWSTVWYGVSDFFGRRRGLAEIGDAVRWRVGMVAQWSADDAFRKATRQRLTEVIGGAGELRAVFAHSLGSLISYDTWLNDPSYRWLVVFGSQIGHPAIRSAFGGRIRPLKDNSRFVQLFNPNDRVFTAAIRLSAENFRRIDTQFDEPGPVNHSAERYLMHDNPVIGLWRPLVSAAIEETGDSEPAKAMLLYQQADQQFREVSRTPDRRALLIGINEYAHGVPSLAGCVNDVFLVSALLQEMKYRPEQIRVLLNARATAEAIHERLQWLMSDITPGDERILYFSGHGTQLPIYNPRGEPDHLDECLVPHDFNWSHATAISDDVLAELYSNLPYEARVIVFLDCCHSGGMSESAGRGRAIAVRGIDPPDDIRHRGIYWDREYNMWLPRKMRDTTFQVHFEATTTAGSKRSASSQQRRKAEVVGEAGLKHRLGGAAHLRLDKLPSNNAERPYMPLIITACQEAEQAFEYRHGVESYGAFTWSVGSALRQLGRQKSNSGLSFEALVRLVRDRLGAIGFQQTPDLRGPAAIKQSDVPWEPPPSSPPAPPVPPASNRSSSKPKK